MSNDGYNPLSPPNGPMTEAEFAAALVDLVHDADDYESDEAFNEAALRLTDRLLCERIDRQERRDA